MLSWVRRVFVVLPWFVGVADSSVERGCAMLPANSNALLSAASTTGTVAATTAMMVASSVSLALVVRFISVRKGTKSVRI